MSDVRALVHEIAAAAAAAPTVTGRDRLGLWHQGPSGARICPTTDKIERPAQALQDRQDQVIKGMCCEVAM